jgi:hypothetical protein
MCQSAWAGLREELPIFDNGQSVGSQMIACPVSVPTPAKDGIVRGSDEAK